MSADKTTTVRAVRLGVAGPRALHLERCEARNKTPKPFHPQKLWFDLGYIVHIMKNHVGQPTVSDRLIAYSPRQGLIIITYFLF